MSKNKKQFWESTYRNSRMYHYYYNRLFELALSRWKWEGLPETVDTRYLELTALCKGQVLVFKDEVMGLLALPFTVHGSFDVYRVPIGRRALSANGYTKELDDKNSVIIWNNLMRTTAMYDIEIFADRLATIERIIDVNVNGQRTPIIITCDQQEKSTLEAVFKKYQGGDPLIWGNGSLSTKGVNVLKADVPYLADKLYDLRTRIWNDAMTYLGISNVSAKRERMVVEEVNFEQGGVLASRNSCQTARDIACTQIKDMFDYDAKATFIEPAPWMVEPPKQEVLTV